MWFKSVEYLLQGDTDVKRPLRLGSGLQLAKKGQRPPFEILVAKINNPEDPLEFKPFEEWGRVDKSNALNNLATSTLTEFEIAKHQIEYLVDDIKETTYDTKNQSDLLYRLSEMYHCIVYISGKLIFDMNYKIQNLTLMFKQQNHKVIQPKKR